MTSCGARIGEGHWLAGKSLQGLLVKLRGVSAERWGVIHDEDLGFGSGFPCN
jgi:hypothetical protein